MYWLHWLPVRQVQRVTSNLVLPSDECSHTPAYLDDDSTSSLKTIVVSFSRLSSGHEFERHSLAKCHQDTRRSTPTQHQLR